MAGVLRGEVRRCNFGQQEGSELAGQRCALVLSRDSFNSDTSLAIVVPTTTQAPRRSHDWYTYIAGAGTWASLRQLKTVPVRYLGEHVGQATDTELDSAITSVVRLVPNADNIPDADGLTGTIWAADIANTPSTTHESLVLVLHYNGSNGMAIVAILGREGRQPSRLAIPVDGSFDVGRRVVLVHQLRALYAPHRFGRQPRGRISAGDLDTVGTALLSIIS